MNLLQSKLGNGGARRVEPRRDFIKGLGVLGVGAWAVSAGVAQVRTAASGQGQRIDVHHHLFPADYRKAIASMNAGGLAAWTVEQSLAEMDKGGIAASVGQRKEYLQQRACFSAIRLMQAIPHCRPQQIPAPQCKRRNEHRGGLDIRHRVLARVSIRQQRAGFFGGETCRGQSQQQVPVELLPAGSCNQAIFRDGRHRHPAEIAGRDVVRMALAAAGFFEDLPRGQVQITEVIGEKDTRKKSGRARSAPHPERYFVIQRKVESRSKNAANTISNFPGNLVVAAFPTWY